MAQYLQNSLHFIFLNSLADFRKDVKNFGLGSGLNCRLTFLIEKNGNSCFFRQHRITCHWIPAASHFSIGGTEIYIFSNKPKNKHCQVFINANTLFFVFLHRSNILYSFFVTLCEVVLTKRRFMTGSLSDS